MFAELAPIIAAGTNLTLMMSAAPNGEICLILMPKKEDGQSAALATPLHLVATPAELDTEISSILTNYVSTRASLVDSLENVKLIMEAAGKTARDEATKGTGKAPRVAEDGDEAEEAEDGETKAIAQGARSSHSVSNLAKPKDDNCDLDLF